MAALKALTLFPSLIAALCYPVNGGATLEAGKLAALDAQGNLVTPTETVGLIVAGRVEGKGGGISAGMDVDNSAGLDGAETADVRPGVYLCNNSAAADEITAAEVGDPCYIIDGETVAKTDGVGTRSVAGIVVGFEGTKVAVAVGFSLFATPTQAPGGSFVQMKTVTIPFNHAALVAESDDGDAVAINVGTALPANAVVVAARFKILGTFVGAGLASLALVVGHAGDTDAFIETSDILGDAIGEYGAGLRGVGVGTAAGGKQIIATLDPDNAAGLDELTAGSVKVDVFYMVAA